MKYGFIGLGNMASAIIEGMISSGRFSDDQILGFNRSEGKTQKLKETVGLIPCTSAAEAATQADVIVLAVKPQMMGGVMEEIARVVGKDKKSFPSRLDCRRHGMKSGFPKGFPSSVLCRISTPK